ncbi:hypothetical protein KZ876_32960, partial [Pseudomonas aeruginosa]|nr:hypothetical protein [Pseudomonas aeruginosa]
ERLVGSEMCIRDRGYVAPPRGDEHTLGASFDFKSEDLAPTLAEHQGNLELLREISPDLLQRLGADDLPLERLEGRAAFRCTSPDYLPLVGPLAERAAFDEAYACLLYTSPAHETLMN